MTSDGTRDGVASPPSTAVASNAVGPDTPRSDDIVDTTELRWFARGPASPDVLRWFGEIGPPSVYEERSDLYRIYGLADVSVKRRFGELFELKVRRSVDGYLGLPGGPGGQPEHWHKWSPADELVGAHRDSQWVAVHKTIAKKTVHVGPRMSGTGDPGRSGPIGCDIETTQVRVGDLEAWSLAFSAHGSGDHRRWAIHQSWRALIGDGAPPPAMADELRVCAAYPTWLRAVVDGDESAGRIQASG